MLFRQKSKFKLGHFLSRRSRRPTAADLRLNSEPAIGARAIKCKQDTAPKIMEQARYIGKLATTPGGIAVHLSG